MCVCVCLYVCTMSHLVCHKPTKLISDNQHCYNIYIYIYIYNITWLCLWPLMSCILHLLSRVKIFFFFFKSGGLIFFFEKWGLFVWMCAKVCVLLNVSIFAYVLLLAGTYICMFAYVLAYIFTYIHIFSLFVDGKGWDKGKDCEKGNEWVRWGNGLLQSEFLFLILW